MTTQLVLKPLELQLLRHICSIEQFLYRSTHRRASLDALESAGYIRYTGPVLEVEPDGHGYGSEILYRGYVATEAGRAYLNGAAE